MNILQFTSNAGPSGRGQHILILSKGLHQRGHEVTFLGPPHGWLSAPLGDAGIPIIERRLRGLRSLITVRELARFVRAQNIQLIHTHTIRATFYAFLISRLARVKVVATVHVMPDVVIYGRPPSGHVHRFIAVSNFVRDALVGRGIATSRVTTIYNGTDFREAKDGAADTLEMRAELGLPVAAQLLGVFAFIGRRKGQDILVQAAPQIVAQCPHAHFVFVGMAAPHEQQRLIKMADVLGLADRVHVTGFREDVARWMAAMDIIVVPSEMETFGMVIVEAMLSGKPVVGVRVGGIPEVIADGQTGLVVEREPAALAEAVSSLLQDPGRRAIMGQTGRERALTCFSAGVMLDNMKAMYDEVVRG